MKVSFITTVYNEEKTVKHLLDSLNSQTKKPHEIVIVDGGSKDKTFLVVSNFKFKIPQKNVKIIKKKGNRSIGRNEAIKNATGDVILCSDAGNVLDKKWVENITRPFENSKIGVVAGYYKGRPQTIFQKCLIPYVLVMPDRVDAKNFLPATRSFAFKKSIWKRVGGFNEEYSHNEDYVFAKKLKKGKITIFFANDAIVYWLPRKNLQEAFVMFFRFAFGDAESGIWRGKVILVYVRYTFMIFIFIFALTMRSFYFFSFVFILIIVYLLWSVQKNYRYSKNVSSIYILPLLQITADMAVLVGTTLGFLKKRNKT